MILPEIVSTSLESCVCLTLTIGGFPVETADEHFTTQTCQYTFILELFMHPEYQRC